MDKPVLVVEDEADLAANYERLLRRHGYRVVSAGLRRTGLRALAAEPLRLVIADLRLPDGDGLDIVRAARALPAPPPVLVATVLGSRATHQAALAAGATAFLAKPFTTDAFRSLVRQLVGSAPCWASGSGPASGGGASARRDQPGREEARPDILTSGEPVGQ